MRGAAPTDAAERFARLRLARSPNVGPVSYRQLMQRFGSATAAIEALPNLLRKAGGRSFVAAPEAAIAAELGRVEAMGARQVLIGDAAYPALLAQMDDAPVVLTLRGDLALVDRTVIAMVGARNASASACRFAREIAHALVTEGAAVVSGLARGIDSAAHVGSLPGATSPGGAIGVIAGGIDVVYPPENASLQEAVATSGLLLAEEPVGIEPRARHFPRRNRIIAGLALGTVVVEAAPRSGSLITARIANEAGREVMAVPGSPLDPRSQGCNQLIRDGATLVQNAADILEAVGGFAGKRLTPTQNRLFDGAAEAFADPGSSERERIEAMLGMNYVPVDELVRQSAMPSPLVQGVLLELELAGRLERGAGGRVRLTA